MKYSWGSQRDIVKSTIYLYSIFHYRNYGADIGKIVIGVLIEKSEIKEWIKFLKILGYKYWDETNNDTYKLFLGAPE